MNKQILAMFTILLFALAITGYAYSHWQKTINIQGTLKMAKAQIIIQNHNTTLEIIETTDHTLKLNGTITPSQTLWTGITIKNDGTTPTTMTLSITTSDTSTEIYFSNQTHFYGPYTAIPLEVWESATTMPPPSGSTTPPELPAQNMLVIWQNITLSETPPKPFTIEIAAIYTATFQTWTDTVSVTYTLTYQGES